MVINTLLTQHDHELKFRSTKEHSNADMLSRLATSVKSKLPVSNMIYSLQIDTLPVTSTEMRTETLTDKALVNVLSHLQRGKWPDKISDDIKPYYNNRNELTIEGYTMGTQSYCTRTTEK